MVKIIHAITVIVLLLILGCTTNSKPATVNVGGQNSTFSCNDIYASSNNGDRIEMSSIPLNGNTRGLKLEHFGNISEIPEEEIGTVLTLKNNWVSQNSLRISTSYYGKGCHLGSKVGENENYFYCNFYVGKEIKTTDANGNILERYYEIAKIDAVLQPILSENQFQNLVAWDIISLNCDHVENLPYQ